MARVVLENVDLTFPVQVRRQWSLKEYVLGARFLPSRNPVRLMRALSNVTVEMSDGERVGVIGHNGAGKTTLLRTIAGVYPPTAGAVDVVGQIGSLFEIHLGFELEASGWDNIRYRGLLLGASPAFLKERSAEIADFTELGPFLDVPVKYYSAGMLMRLAFAISTAVEPEILLVDECLSVGDEAFQGKAQDRLRGMMDRARLMVMVSHDLESVLEFCSRVIRLERGRVVDDGAPEAVVAAYRRSAREDSCPGVADFEDPECPVETPAIFG